MKSKRLSVLCLLVFLLNLISPCLAEIKFVSNDSYAAGAVVLDSSSSSKTSAAATTLTWSHVVGTTVTNKMLVVAVGAEGSNVTVSSVKYNGISMTEAAGVNSSTASPYDRASIYYLANPPSGTYNVVITMAASVTGITGRAISLGNVYQGAPEYVTTGFTNSGTSVSSTINLEAPLTLKANSFSSNFLITKGLNSSNAIFFGTPHSSNFKSGPTTMTLRPE